MSAVLSRGGPPARLRWRRGNELALLIVVAAIVAGAYVLASLGATASLPTRLLPFLAFVLGLFGLAHVGVRRFAPAADQTLVPLAGLLNGIGYVFVARLDQRLAGFQAIWSALAVLAFLATLAVVRRTRDLERYRYTFALIGVGLLLLPLVPGIGRTVNGARIWIRVGPVGFQPGEAAKLALAVFFASYLVERRELLALARKVGPIHLPELRLRHIGPIAGAWGISLLVMIAEKDLGSSLLFFALFITMLWLATGRGFFLASGAALFLGGALVAHNLFSHVQDRVKVWLDPFRYAADEGFQVVQSLFAFGTGGVAGTGIGLGSPQKIPEVETDFIFAAIGEELGLAGTSAVLIAFILMIGAGLRIALSTERPFDQLLAAGLTAILGIQTFIILGGVTRLVPLTGITLPFVSYGGSSLVANWVLIALLLRISDDSAHARTSGPGPRSPAAAARADALTAVGA